MGMVTMGLGDTLTHVLYTLPDLSVSAGINEISVEMTEIEFEVETEIITICEV